MSNHGKYIGNPYVRGQHPHLEVSDQPKASDAAKVDYLTKVIKALREEILTLKTHLEAVKLDRAVEENQVQRKLEFLADLKTELELKSRGPKIIVKPRRWQFWRRLSWKKKINQASISSKSNMSYR